MAKIVPLKVPRRSVESPQARVVRMPVGERFSRNVMVKDMTAARELRRDGGKTPNCETDRDARYKRRAQVLLYQAASLLAEVEGSEQRLAWLLEDCADLLVREEQMGPVA